MNKIYIFKRIVAVVVFIVVLSYIGSIIQNVIKPNGSTDYGLHTAFKNEEANSIDVLFLGASNTFHSINPLVLYEETGITGYVYSSASQSLNITESYLKEALRTQSPKVVCLEVIASRRDLNNEVYEQRWRWGYTHFPDAFNMYQTLYSYLGKVDAEYLSYIFPVLRYKDRWSDLAKNDFEGKIKNQYYKGFYPSSSIRTVSYTEEYWEDAEWSIPESSLESLNNIKKICDANNIALVLFKAPTPTLWKQKYSDEIQKFADENGIVFLDYNAMLEELKIDTSFDFHDPGHMNKYGAEKITKHIGGFLKEEYSLEDHRNGENNSWDVSIKERTRRNTKFKGEDINSYLAQISHDKYTIACMISGEIDKSIYDLLESKFLVVGDAFVYEDGENIYVNTNEEAYSWHLEFDEKDIALRYNPQVLDETGKIINKAEYRLYINGDNRILVDRGITFVIIDDELQEIMSVVSFDADNGYARVEKK